MTTISSAAAEAVRQLVENLVAGNYAAIAADGRIGRLTEDEVKRAIAEYGRTLVPLPAGGVDEADVYLSDNDPCESTVDVPLWTAEEGRSDLTLSLTIIEGADGPMVLIDDLHVL